MDFVIAGVLCFGFVVAIFWLFFPGIFRKSPRNEGSRSTDLIYETQDELSKREWVLCIGSRGSIDKVRCIKTPDSFIYLPYSEASSWERKGDFIIVNGIPIPYSLARDTHMQCWATSPTDKTVSKEEFDSYLRKLALQ